MKRQDKQVLRWIGVVLALILFLGWFLLWPLNSYVEAPGTATNLRSFVRVKDHPDPGKGSFMITSVALQRAHPATYLVAKAVPYLSIEKAADVTGGQSGATFDRVQHFYMQSSINEAIAVAFQAAHQPVSRKYLGIYVLQVEPNSKFKRVIKVGDTITKVDGRHFNTAQGFQKYIGKQKIGSPLTVTYERAGRQHQVTRRLVRLTAHRAGIGILLTNNMKVKTRVPVKVDPGQLGGPSGGLMFTLQIYEQISGHDLQRGRKIAGTGTIAPDGSVGEIGGIDKKVIAAHRAGATIFLAPYIKPTKLVLKYEDGHQTNYQLAKKTAKRYAPGMKVVPVTSFKQAVHYLEQK
ncbi:SepM family pheromone-processing serine protease [uncultured Limosilactobacillus sp.]|uniref:SepM family pheromone-processing serine protease n=1 Tax=uncultured Limosilactobacillus sp. TaxID=2837629 RepID=UPI002595919B|nr:SepM family pheromone-processing serine protease [uncultured Limosilactobacillus sp.]